MISVAILVLCLIGIGLSNTRATPSTLFFDGSEYSLGGNGEYVPHEPQNLTIPVPSKPQVFFPAGSGGGCITDGPFVNVTSNLGPHFPVQETTGLEYNPHCLKRDFSEALSQQFLITASVENLMSQKSIGYFRQVLDAGIHFAGHGTVLGGMSDLWMSPEDPVFFFHHGKVDRLWSIWQEQDLAARMNQTSDTQTWDNGKMNHFIGRFYLFSNSLL